MHTNSIQLLNREISGFGQKSDILLSFCKMDLIAILSQKENKIVWKWGRGIVSRQHHPTLLDNGNVLIFDNGRAIGRSRILELDPVTKKIVWEYQATPPEKFYTPTRGAAQRFPNGNTLITESDKGHVFEVTDDGEIVWEFYNPNMNTETQEREAIYRMIRITDPQNYPNLAELQ